MKLYNTLTRQLQDFIPIDENHIKMYVCGPTVYNHIHLGNARSIVIYDVLYRLLLKKFKQITYIRNITDIDDKIVNTAIEQGKKAIDISEEYNGFFQEASRFLNCLMPTHQPKATEEIQDMIDFIKHLLTINAAYKLDDDILLDTSKVQNYGNLANKKIDELEHGKRIQQNSNKKNENDFILWKSVKDDFGYDCDLGYGRPGWHTECVVMSKKYLGENFDIHGGGVDLVFPHHENEFAQAKCCDYKFANYWVHNGFLMVEGKKMSKSLNNFILVKDLQEKYSAGAIKLALLSGHYRKPINFTFKLLDDCQKFIDKLPKIDNDLPEADFDILCDDLNTPKFIANIHSQIKKEPKKAISNLKFIGVL